MLTREAFDEALAERRAPARDALLARRPASISCASWVELWSAFERAVISHSSELPCLNLFSECRYASAPGV